jgi:hypothetical protein
VSVGDGRKEACGLRRRQMCGITDTHIPGEGPGRQRLAPQARSRPYGVGHGCRAISALLGSGVGCNAVCGTSGDQIKGGPKSAPHAVSWGAQAAKRSGR